MNKVILMGLCGDPKVKHFDDGRAIVTFSLLTNNDENDLVNLDGFNARSSEMHNIVLRDNLAVMAEKNIHSGFEIFVTGKKLSRSYVDSQNMEHYVTEIWADEMQIISKSSPLYHQQMGGAGTISCYNCGYKESITSFIHGINDADTGYQCQLCGNFFTLNDSQKTTKPLVCSCGGELSRDKALFCPQCKSKSMRYDMEYIT